MAAVSGAFPSVECLVGIVSLSDLALRGPQELYPYATRNHHVVYHGNECGGSDDGMKFSDLLRDPLIRLVMKSDGVTEQDMLAVMDQLRRDLAEREVPCAQPSAQRLQEP